MHNCSWLSWNLIFENQYVCLFRHIFTVNISKMVGLIWQKLHFVLESSFNKSNYTPTFSAADYFLKTVQGIGEGKIDMQFDKSCFNFQSHKTDLGLLSFAHQFRYEWLSGNRPVKNME